MFDLCMIDLFTLISITYIPDYHHLFINIRDKDKDLKLNPEEVKDWIIPPDYDHTDAETKHLIFEADANKVIADC